MILAEAISRLDSRNSAPPSSTLNQTKTLSFCPAIDVNSYGLSESLYPIKKAKKFNMHVSLFPSSPQGTVHRVQTLP